MLTDEQKETFRRALELRDARDAAKAAYETAEKEWREKEAELWDVMTEEGEIATKDAGMKVSLGEPYGTVTFSPRETHFGRILNLRAATEFFESRAMNDEMTELRISKARLNEYVRRVINGTEPMPPGVDYYTNKGITITRPKS